MEGEKGKKKCYFIIISKVKLKNRKLAIIPLSLDRA